MPLRLPVLVAATAVAMAALPQPARATAPEGHPAGPATAAAANAQRFTPWRTLTADEQALVDDAVGETAKALEAQAQPRAGNLGSLEGDLDPHIRVHAGEPGIVRRAIDVGNTPNDRAVGVGERADGKLYLVGQAGEPTPDATVTRIAIVRLDALGRNDASFGSNGRQLIELANPRLELVKAVALMHDGYERFYVLARDFELTNDHEFALICLRTPTTGGDQPFEACPGFGTGLVRYIGFDVAGACSTQHDVPRDLFLDESATTARRIYLAGSAQRAFNDCADQDFAVARVDLNGALDATFSEDGLVTVGVPPAGGGAWIAAAHAVARRADGRIVLGGSTGIGAAERAVAVQLLASGVVDAAFCAVGNSTCSSPPEHRAGRRAWSTDGAASRVTALAPTFGNGVYVARWRQQTSATVGLVARIDGGGGCSVFCNDASMLPAADARLIPTALRFHGSSDPGTDGQVVAANWGYSGSAVNEARVYVYRFSADVAGNELVNDTGFSSGSIGFRQDISFPGASGATRNARPRVLELDRRGRYLIAGTAAFSAADLDFGFARLQRDVILADGFGH